MALYLVKHLKIYMVNQVIGASMLSVSGVVVLLLYNKNKQGTIKVQTLLITI